MARGKGPAVAAIGKAKIVEVSRVGRNAARAPKNRGLTATEREELAQLRQRVKTLERERDMLEEATAFFATHSAWGSDLWRRRKRAGR